MTFCAHSPSASLLGHRLRASNPECMLSPQPSLGAETNELSAWTRVHRFELRFSLHSKIKRSTFAVGFCRCALLVLSPSSCILSLENHLGFPGRGKDGTDSLDLRRAVDTTDLDRGYGPWIVHRVRKIHMSTSRADSGRRSCEDITTSL